MEAVKTVYINLEEGDWSNCATVPIKRSRRRYCAACKEEHDIGCFFHYRGGILGCMMNKASRSKAIAKIKGTAGVK